MITNQVTACFISSVKCDDNIRGLKRVLKRKYNINGPAFKKILKSNHIQPSVFAFQAKIELTKVKNALESKDSVPKDYLSKLEELFHVSDKC